MIIWGINAMNHDASLSVVDSVSRSILFAAHSERYSRFKNDEHLNAAMIADAFDYGGSPDLVVWHENPLLKRIRYLKAGQYAKAFSGQSVKSYLRDYQITAPIVLSTHHESHAAGGFYTSGFKHATVLVIDAIGENLTSSIWAAAGSSLVKKWSSSYPNSIGLFYSAMTDVVGLKANEEEYIFMGMAAYAEPLDSLVEYLLATYFEDGDVLKQSYNFHKGVKHDELLNYMAMAEYGRFLIAASAQKILEMAVGALVLKAKELGQSENLVYSGGVALNCVTNSKVLTPFKNVWIMPNPGDAGNSLGAIANHLRTQLKWETPFLGHNIDTEIDPVKVVDELLTTGFCGVAAGRAEFGPRALGNRSLLADPRRDDIQEKVNALKGREQFRPFAPAVLLEHAQDYFLFPDGIIESPYMQYVARVVTDELPGVTHFDGTARVQTVTKAQAPQMHAILTEWVERTGCPVLLNTSLNVKGEPLSNTASSMLTWADRNHIKIF